MVTVYLLGNSSFVLLTLSAWGQLYFTVHDSNPHPKLSSDGAVLPPAGQMWGDNGPATQTITPGGLYWTSQCMSTWDCFPRRIGVGFSACGETSLCWQDLRGHEAPHVGMWSSLSRWLPAVACCIFGYAPSQWTFSSSLEVRLGLLVHWASPSCMPALTGMLAAMYREGFPSRLTQIGGDLWPFTLKVVKCFNNLYFYL